MASTPNVQLPTPKGVGSPLRGGTAADMPARDDFRPGRSSRSPWALRVGRWELTRWARCHLRGKRNLLAALGTLAVVGAIWLRCGPLPDGLLESASAPSTIVVDRNGVPLYEALSGDGTRTAPLTADTIPETAAAATIAAEDRRFWSHYGVDPIAILRAMKHNLGEGQIVEGGSTITQQAAKLLLLRQAPRTDRNWRTKVREAIVAIRLEHRLAKREILAIYLNLASYGNQMTGLERASRAYFGTDSRMLTPAQAAFLAGLPQRPTRFNPYRNQALAESRQRVVLARMRAANFISAAQLDEARRERLNLARGERPFLAPHFVEMVLAGAGPNRPSRIETTLDAGLQRDIAGIIQTYRPALQRHGAGNVAVVVLDNVSGAWLAWEGSGDYFDATRGGSINGPIALRQPGSALKPFTYALAFEQGFTPATVLPDVPLHFPTAEQGVVYSPRNYDGRYRGPLLARAALAGSENVPAVSLASDLGVPALLRFLHRAGFSTFDMNAAHYGLGLTLGNAEVRLDELVAAYASFARGGEWRQPHYVRTNGETPRRAVVSPRTAFWITDILSDADARAYIFGRGGSLELPFQVAVKTGTSQAYHDNWTVGYTRRVTVGVWVGNFDRRPLRNSSGVTGAAPIFQAVMLAAHKRTGGVEEPVAHPDESVEAHDICALSGERANPWCPVRRREWLQRDAAPVPCSWHHLDGDAVIVVWPAVYREWARRNADQRSFRLKAEATRATDVSSPLNLVASAFRGKDAAAVRPTHAALQIVNPPEGATYLIDPTLRREFQTLPLRAVAPSPTKIEWTVNGDAVANISSESVVEWPLRVGRHRITARAATGQVAESVVVVR
jgi:penicillin-binding protein 1C